MTNIINNFINFLYGNLLLLQFGSLVISGIIIALIVFLNLKLNLTGEKLEHWMDVWASERIDQRRSLKSWKQIRKRLKTGGATQLKLAILEADRILDELTVLAGYPGRNLDERLENVDSSQIANIEELRQVHRIRNRIVAEPDFTLTPDEVDIALNIYKRTFVDVGLIGEGD